jgi:hypothetical protein
MSNKTSVACIPGALPGGLQRTSFFNGMFLTQSDLEVEQRFWRMKRRLTNRALGQGVVWGLRVTLDQQAQRFTVHPGYGVDCCGNDLLVQASSVARCGDLLDVTDPAIASLLTQASGNQVALILEYAECPEEPRAVHKDACTPTSDACEPSRVRETARLSIAALPAPAASPVASFLDRLDQLHEDMIAAPDPLETEVFPEDAPAAVAANLAVPFRLVVRLGERETVLEATPFLSATAPAAAPGALGRVITSKDPAQELIEVHFELTPDPGVVFYDGSVTMVDPQPGPETWGIAAPFDLQLAWSIRVPVSPLPPDAVKPTFFRFRIDQLAWAPLFGGGERKVATPFEITCQVTMTAVDPTPLPTGELSLRGCVEQLRLAGLNDKPISVENGGRRDSGACLDPLGKGFFLDGLPDGGSAPKTILLAALYGWLTNAFGSSKGYQATADQMNGQRIVGSWLYLTAWRLLFGADPAAPHSPDARQKLANLLDTLMAEWCKGFFYAGPRCDAAFHGAVLGTITADQNGLVKAFDMWQGRRWVLTGPLVNHWGAQLGLAPLDLVAGRLVNTICCLGLGQAPGTGSKVSMALPGLGTDTPEISMGPNGLAGADRRHLDNAGVFLSDGCYLLFGSAESVPKLLAQNGLTAVATRTVSWVGFVKRLIEALAAPRAPGRAPSTYELYALDGLAGEQPFLMVATDPHVPGTFEQKRAAVQALLREAIADHQALAPQFGLRPFPPLALPALSDFFIEVMFEMPLAELRNVLIGQGLKGTDTALAALRGGGVITCGDALALGIEALADLAAPTPADQPQTDPVVAALWQLIIEGKSTSNPQAISVWEACAEGASDGLGQWLGSHPGQTFRRLNLLDKEVQSVVSLMLVKFELLSPAGGPDALHCAAVRAAGLTS